MITAYVPRKEEDKDIKNEQDFLNEIASFDKWLDNQLAKAKEKREETKRSEQKVDHPAYYNQGKIEAIDYIEDHDLGFCLGNVIKYVTRAGHKGDALEDLKKARWYLDRRIKELETK